MPPYDVNLPYAWTMERLGERLLAHLEIKGKDYKQRGSATTTIQNHRKRLTVIVDEQPKCASAGLFADGHCAMKSEMPNATATAGLAVRCG